MNWLETRGKTRSPGLIRPNPGEGRAHLALSYHQPRKGKALTQTHSSPGLKGIQTKHKVSPVAWARGSMVLLTVISQGKLIFSLLHWRLPFPTGRPWAASQEVLGRGEGSCYRCLARSLSDPGESLRLLFPQREPGWTGELAQKNLSHLDQEIYLSPWARPHFLLRDTGWQAAPTRRIPPKQVAWEGCSFLQSKGTRQSSLSPLSPEEAPAGTSGCYRHINLVNCNSTTRALKIKLAL